jgi:hypothetical protein
MLGAAGAKDAPVPRRLAWTVGPETHSLEVFVPPDLDESSIAVGSASSGKFLRSVVGPMVSTFRQEDTETERGGFTTQIIEVEYRSGYAFSLVKYLDDSSQAGRVAAAWLKKPAAEYRRGASCPDPAGLTGSTQPFARIVEGLEAARCIRTASLESPSAFWIDRWDGSENVVLTIQAWHPVGRRSALNILTFQAQIRAPAEWLPWLSAATRGDGAIYSDLRGRVASLPKEELASVRANLRPLDAGGRRKLIESDVYRRRRAPASAADLIAEFFPRTQDRGPDLETQWAWSDQFLFLLKAGRADACLEAGARLAEAEWERATARAAVYNLTECAGQASSADPEWRARLAACKAAPAPLRCARPLLLELKSANK